MPKSVLITGASKGLGCYLAQAFLDAGYQVFAGERSHSDRLARLATESAALTRVTLDISSREAVAHAAEFVAARSDGLDVLVNNAAVLPEAGREPIESMNIEAALSVYDVNALGPLRVVQAFLPLLRRGTQRTIVNVSSEAGSIGDCWRKADYAYCMSKAAMNMQTAILKNHLEPEGFKLLAVHPGWLRTDMGGPDATLDPADSARALVTLTEDARSQTDTFVDHLGKALRW